MFSRLMNVPLKTSLNSPGGAWMTKFAAMRTCGKTKWNVFLCLFKAYTCRKFNTINTQEKTAIFKNCVVHTQWTFSLMPVLPGGYSRKQVMSHTQIRLRICKQITSTFSPKSEVTFRVCKLPQQHKKKFQVWFTSKLFMCVSFIFFLIYFESSQ